MIKLTHLLKEEESFTATSKKTGQTSVFKSKDSRDAAVKAGTHSKIDKDSEEDDKSKKEKPNMFSKDTGYNTPDDKKDAPKKDEPFNLTDDFIDAIKVQYKNVSSQTPEQKKALEKSLINKLDKEQLKKLAFSDVNVVSDMASKKWYNLSYPSDDEPKKDKKDKSEPSTSDSIDNAYDAKDFKSTVKSLKGKVSDEDYNEIEDNLKALANLQSDLGDIDRDEDNEEWGMQKDTIDVEVDDLKGLIKQAISKSEPTKDSTKERAGNPKVNKVVSGKAKKLGITPQKLGKEEYESRMSKAAVEALTDANFHSEARKLISVLEDNPDFAKDPNQDPKKPKDIFSDEYDEWRKTSVYGSTFYDSAEGTDDIAHSATGESGWDGIESLDAIAYDLKMNGSKKLAAKLQSIFEGTTKRGFKNQSLKNLI